MCTAYEIGRTDFDVDWLVADALEATMFEEGVYQIIRPTLKAPVILPDRTFRIMSWGFRYTPRGQKKQRTVVNSREDQLGIRLWKDKFKSNRCLIPASAFFEWVQGDDGKMVPLRFTRPGNKGILMAGVWGEEEGRGESSGATERQLDRWHFHSPSGITDGLSELTVLTPGSDAPPKEKSGGLQMENQGAAPVDLHQSIARSVHTTPRYERYAMQRRETAGRLRPRLPSRRGALFDGRAYSSRERQGPGNH